MNFEEYLKAAIESEIASVKESLANSGSELSNINEYYIRAGIDFGITLVGRAINDMDYSLAINNLMAAQKEEIVEDNIEIVEEVVSNDSNSEVIEVEGE